MYPSSVLRAALRALAVTVLVALAAAAGTARAATLAITFTQCGTASTGFHFTLNGAGFDAATALEVDVTSSEADAVANSNYVFADGVAAPFITPVTTLAADGTFAFTFTAGAGQSLPATIAVYSFDTTNEVTAGQLLTTTVSASTVCADGTSLGVTGGVSRGGGGSPGGAGGGVPTTRADCRRNLWRTYGLFANEGDCVSFVATNGRNGPALLP